MISSMIFWSEVNCQLLNLMTMTVNLFIMFLFMFNVY
jgi:hypothetical protein